MKILILGVTGMLGNAVMRALYDGEDSYSVYGTLRSPAGLRHFPAIPTDRFVTYVDVENTDNLTEVFGRIRPDVVINCIGLVKQHGAAKDPLVALPLNAMLPHRIAQLCALMDARMIHISTDCVFDGAKGNYLESDSSDATDLYGKSKFMGEVHAPHTITLRTSIIGHELGGANSLLNWFLSQKGSVKGFSRAIFSGLPTVTLAMIIRDYVLPLPELSGLYHVAADPISKFDLLRIIADIYKKDITLVPDDNLVIDRSLNGSRFAAATGFATPSWPDLIRQMHAFG
jgi:dTDP-4-dehydrorhamnose reductase